MVLPVLVTVEPANTPNILAEPRSMGNSVAHVGKTGISALIRMTKATEDVLFVNALFLFIPNLLVGWLVDTATLTGIKYECRRLFLL
jgi:hypothetical protein